MVADDDKETVQVQYDHQKILDAEEDEHLVNHIEVNYNSESDHQEGTVLDEKAPHNAPDVHFQTREQGATLAFWLNNGSIQH